MIESAFAQQNPIYSGGAIEDWTHHHIVFSNPGTLEDAERNGKAEEWHRIVSDSRYRMQWFKRYGSDADFEYRPARERRKPHPKKSIHADWNLPLSTSNHGVAIDMYPAKYTFAPIGSPDCTNDFVVFPIKAAALLACVAWMLFGWAGVFPPYVIGFVAGVASGSAMLPYTVIKEANPPQFGGTATGVINFLNFTFSALLGPVFGWILQHISGGARPMEKGHYQAAFAPLLVGVAVAIVLAFLLKETGSAAKESPSAV